MPRRVFLHAKLDTSAYKNSRHHTCYAGAGVAPAPGVPAPLHKLEFINGVAKNVDENVYERFKDLGICDTTPPKRVQYGDEDDEE